MPAKKRAELFRGETTYRLLGYLISDFSAELCQTLHDRISRRQHFIEWLVVELKEGFPCFFQLCKIVYGMANLARFLFNFLRCSATQLTVRALTLKCFRSEFFKLHTRGFSAVAKKLSGPANAKTFSSPSAMFEFRCSSAIFSETFR